MEGRLSASLGLPDMAKPGYGASAALTVAGMGARGTT